MSARQSTASDVMQRPAQPAAGSRVSSAEAALAVLRADLLGEDERGLVDATASRLAEADVYVVAVGEFKRGKSSLLNALVGERILPVGVVPLTAVVTVLRRGRPEAVGVYADGRRGEVDAARLADYVTEGGNPGNRLGLSRVEVGSPRFALPPRAVLIDTPGLRSVVDGGEDHTLDFLPQVDVALMVLSVDQPLSGDEQDLAVRLRDQGAEIVFVLNKTDYLSPAETEEAKSFVAERLRLSGFSDAALFAVSSKRAAQNDGADGVPRLQDYLTALLERRHDAIRREQSDRRVRRLLDDLQMSYAVQREVAGSAEEKLAHNLRELEAARKRIVRMAEEQDAIFAHRVQAAERKLSDEMSAFRRTLEAALLAEVEGLVGEPELDEHRVDEVMAEAIQRLLVDQLDRQSGVLEKVVTEAYLRLLSELDSLAVAQAESASAILGVSVPRPEASSRTALSPSVSVKLRDDPVGLEMLTAALQAPLPGRMRRRFLLKRSRERAGELANRHAGRTRSELAGAMRAETMKALRDAHQQLDAMTSSIDRAVEQGLVQRALTAEEASGARRRIQHVLDSIAEARRLLAEGHSSTAGSGS
jgi:ribosome biogenesis GTPase A